jgi:hypothetical protein
VHCFQHNLAHLHFCLVVRQAEKDLGHVIAHEKRGTPDRRRMTEIVKRCWADESTQNHQFFVTAACTAWQRNEGAPGLIDTESAYHLLGRIHIVRDLVRRGDLGIVLACSPCRCSQRQRITTKSAMRLSNTATTMICISVTAMSCRGNRHGRKLRVFNMLTSFDLEPALWPPETIIERRRTTPSSLRLMSMPGEANDAVPSEGVVLQRERTLVLTDLKISTVGGEKL